MRIYNDKGNEILEERDSGCDGEAEYIITTTYDEFGNQLTTEGQSGSGRNATYDENGNQLTEENDTDGDGNPNSITTFTYECWQ